MYTPERYKGHDLENAIAFIRQYNFGTIVSQYQEQPLGSHLPFVISQRESEKLILSSHFAKANPQWTNLEGQSVLIIFTEPHAYISPKFYNKKQNVPTWNYIAVHVYGNVKLVQDEGKVFEMLEEMMENFEAAYKSQWNELDASYKIAMAKGIVAFEMEIEDLQFKQKLSQNKKQEEQDRIIKHFSESEDDNEKAIAHFMKFKDGKYELE